MGHTTVQAEVALPTGVAAVSDGPLGSLAVAVGNVDGQVVFLVLAEIRKRGGSDEFVLVQALLNLLIEGFVRDSLVALELLVQVHTSPVRRAVVVDEFGELLIFDQKVYIVAVFGTVPGYAVIQKLLHEEVRVRLDLGISTDLTVPAGLTMIQVGFIGGFL